MIISDINARSSPQTSLIGIPQYYLWWRNKTSKAGNLSPAENRTNNAINKNK